FGLHYQAICREELKLKRKVQRVSCGNLHVRRSAACASANAHRIASLDEASKGEFSIRIGRRGGNGLLVTVQRHRLLSQRMTFVVAQNAGPGSSGYAGARHEQEQGGLYKLEHSGGS